MFVLLRGKFSDRLFNGFSQAIKAEFETGNGRKCLQRTGLFGAIARINLRIPERSQQISAMMILLLRESRSREWFKYFSVGGQGGERGAEPKPL